jgi:hypothetical protein
MVVLVALALRKKRGAFHPLRLAGTTIAITVLLLGGLVVSVKIGGGYGLHNLDAYLLMLLLVALYIFTGRAATERITGEPWALDPIWVSLLAMLVPIWFAIQYTPAFVHWDAEQSAALVQLVKARAEEVASRGEQVLFISERQLIAMDGIHVPLVPEYEQDFLMEMVMSHNRAYLDQFQADLRDQRFGLIVAFPQAVRYDQSLRNFSEENNYWVQDVSTPLLCYYESSFNSAEYRVALYVPRDQPCE